MATHLQNLIPDFATLSIKNQSVHKPMVITVVRDLAMYKHCVMASANSSSYDRVVIDNRERNEPIPVCYNRCLSTFDYARPTWFVFCHEDFAWTADLTKVLEGLPTDAIYGPVGARLKTRMLLDVNLEVCGKILQSNKDGSDLHPVGLDVKTGTPVDTLDCVCMIVHSELVRRFGLRFDESLSFDCYVEDFCIAAKEHYGILSRILAFSCRHWSGGMIGGRYRRSRDYLRRKWPHCTYASTCSYTVGGHKGLAWLKGELKTLGFRTHFRKLLNGMRGSCNR